MLSVAVDLILVLLQVLRFVFFYFFIDLPISQRLIIDFFAFRETTSAGDQWYTCSGFSPSVGWNQVSQHGVPYVFNYDLAPGVSILVFYERENGIQFYQHANVTNAPISLVFYCYGVLWFRLVAGTFSRILFYSYTGPFGVEWFDVNPSVGFYTVPVPKWKYSDASILPFEVARQTTWSLAESLDKMVDVEFYYHSYQFNITGIDFI